MEDWQIEAIEQLLEGQKEATGDVAESFNRFLIESPDFGQSRYHVVSYAYDGGLVIDQTDHGEKYQQRVTLDRAQLFPLLRILLARYLQEVHEEGARQKAEAERLARVAAGLEAEDPLGDLDDHPF